MNFDLLASHVATLGGVEPPPEGNPTFDESRQHQVAKRARTALPAALAWWWTRYGGGVSFAHPVVHPDARADEVLFGWFLTFEEVCGALDAHEDSLAPHRVPIANDGGDNFLVVGSDGSVWWHIHDAPLDRNTYRVAETFEAFVLSLRRAD